MPARTIRDVPAIVSVDDHIQEPAHIWTTRLAGRYRDVGPRGVRERVTYQLRDGSDRTTWADVWHYEDARVPVTLVGAPSDRAPEEVDDLPILFDELRPGAYDAAARLPDMDRDHVRASLCFPNLWVRFCGQRFLSGDDKELALACVRAYNDFLVDEWERAGAGRLFGVAILPLWDRILVAEEVRRVASRGLRAVTFMELPTRLGLPSLYSGEWEPFFDAVDETGAIVCIHIGSSSTHVNSSDDAPVAVGVLHNYCNSSLSLTDWILAGVFDRHPRMKLMYSEGEAGWIPFLLGRLDVKWNSGYPVYGFPDLKRSPSAYFRDHVYACVTEDPAAAVFLEMYGSDNLCFETDYPHQDGSFPHSAERALHQFGHLPEDKFRAVVCENGARLLGLAASNDGATGAR